MKFRYLCENNVLSSEDNSSNSSNDWLLFSIF